MNRANDIIGHSRLLQQNLPSTDLMATESRFKSAPEQRT
jgi:hypothetical protein